MEENRRKEGNRQNAFHKVSYNYEQQGSNFSMSFLVAKTMKETRSVVSVERRVQNIKS